MSFGAPTPPAGRSGSGVDATAREAAAAAQAAADEAAGIGEAAQATADSALSGSAHDSAARSAAATADGKAVAAQAALSGSANDATARAAAAAAQAGSGNDSTARAAAAAAQTTATRALSWRGFVVRRAADRWLPQASETEVLLDTLVSNSSDGGLLMSGGRVVIGPGVSLVRAWTTTRLNSMAEYHSAWIRHYRGAAIQSDYIGFAEGANGASLANVSHPIVVQQGDTLAHLIYGQKSGGFTVPSASFYPFAVEVLG